MGYEQSLVEIDHAQARGEQHFERGERDSAEREFRKMFE